MHFFHLQDRYTLEFLRFVLPLSSIYRELSAGLKTHKKQYLAILDRNLPSSACFRGQKFYHYHYQPVLVYHRYLLIMGSHTNGLAARSESRKYEPLVTEEEKLLIDVVVHVLGLEGKRLMRTKDSCASVATP